MAIATRYPTRPLDCWGKLREIRRKYAVHSWDVKERGGFAVAAQLPLMPVVAGIGEFARRIYGPYFSKAMREPEVLRQFHEAADAGGYPRGEMCSSMHHQIGQMLLGLTQIDPMTGVSRPVDFILETNFCHSVSKTAQIGGEVMGVPFFVIDVPHTGGEAAQRYVYGQLMDAIGWLEEITGRTFDDGKFVEAMTHWWQRGALYAGIGETLKAIPAPIDYWQVRALRVPAQVAGHTAEVAEFYQMALDEVRERVKEGISAFGVEACRLSHEGEEMFYADKLLADTVMRYGAVFVTGDVGFNTGLWYIEEDGSWRAAPTLQEMGLTLRTREDAVNLLARSFVDYGPIFHCLRVGEKPTEVVKKSQDWHSQGAVLHMDIGCRGMATGVLEAKIALEEAGFPTVSYESSNSDPRDFTPGQVTDRLESFLERLGLERLS